MWTRKELKDRAKAVLRTSYWKAFLVSLVLAIVSGGIPGCSYNSAGIGGQRGESEDAAAMPGVAETLNGVETAFIIIVIIVAVIAALIGLAFRIFLSAPLEVGIRQYFKQSALGEVNMNHMGYAFSGGRYISIVKGMLWAGFLNFLWFLLLIIPGIVKGYAYSMVPYILADNPGIGTRRVVELSNRMTRGQKWKMFVLDLSFIGWYLLGMLALFVGILFVFPYVNATKAELYLVLRHQALNDGVSSSAELNLQ